MGTPLSGPRNTPRMADCDYNTAIYCAAQATQTFYIGQLVSADASGLLVPGATVATQRAIGIFGVQPALLPSTSYVSSGVAGASSFEVQLGTFKLDNSGTDPVVQADIGKACYIEDDHTVSHTATGKSIAGRVMAIDDATSPTGVGIWVAVGPISP